MKALDHDMSVVAVKLVPRHNGALVTKLTELGDFLVTKLTDLVWVSPVGAIVLFVLDPLQWR